MTMINDAFVSLKDNAVKAVKAKPQNVAKGGKARKAAKAKSARQKANQTNRKASGAARGFKLTPEALKELRAEGGKGFINPYRDGSTYAACTAAIRKLGPGRFHPFDKIVAAVVAEMGDAAKEFKAKKKRSDATGKDWKERVIQNVRVLARPDYGAKLRQIGYEVRTDKSKGAGLFKLGGK